MSLDRSKELSTGEATPLLEQGEEWVARAMKKTNDLRLELDNLQMAITNLQSVRVELANNPSDPDYVMSLQRRAESLIRDAMFNCQNLKGGLKGLKEDLKKKKASDAEKKMLSNTIGFIASRYSELAKTLTETRDEYESHRRDLVRRRLQIVHPFSSSEDVEKMIDDQQYEQQIFAQVLDVEIERAKVATMIAREQREDSLQLERKIQQVHQTFVEVQTVVDAQHLDLGIIEENVNIVSRSTSNALNHISHAEVSTIKSRVWKYQCCLLVCGSLFCLLFLLLVAGIIVVALMDTCVISTTVFGCDSDEPFDLPYYVYIILSLVVGAELLMMMCFCGVLLTCIIFNRNYLNYESIAEISQEEDMR